MKSESDWQIEKAFTVMALYYSSLPKNQLTNEFWIALLAVLKIKRPAIYQRLSAGTLTLKEFLSETRLDHLVEYPGEGISQEWGIDMINFCLMSDAELGAVTKDDSQIGVRSGPSRMYSWLTP